MRDFISQLAEEITKGTKLPFAYAREVLKLTALAALPEDYPTVDWFPVHRRQYLILISETPGTGKGETFRRVKATVERARKEGSLWPLEYILGDELGSPQYAAVRFGGERTRAGKEPAEVKVGGIEVKITQRPRIVHYDEGKRLMQQDNVGHGAERGLLTMFTQLFEGNSHAMGSLQNGACSVTNANVSLMLQFTKSGFESAFTGRGATSSGFLSRCVLVSAEPNRVEGVWRKVSSEKVRELVGKIQTCIDRKKLTQEDGVEPIRKALFAELGAADPLHSARLEFLFAQDLFARSVFSDGIVTPALATLSAEWVRGQLRSRHALWPLDASPDKYERVYLTLLKAFETTPTMSLRDMKRACHTNRAGSGGLQALTSQLSTMMRAGEVVREGRNRQGKELFTYKG
jgi:hypothetical protein